MQRAIEQSLMELTLSLSAKKSTPRTTTDFIKKDDGMEDSGCVGQQRTHEASDKPEKKESDADEDDTAASQNLLVLPLFKALHVMAGADDAPHKSLLTPAAVPHPNDEQQAPGSPAPQELFQPMAIANYAQLLDSIRSRDS